MDLDPASGKVRSRSRVIGAPPGRRPSTLCRLAPPGSHLARFGILLLIALLLAPSGWARVASAQDSGDDQTIQPVVGSDPVAVVDGQAVDNSPAPADNSGNAAPVQDPGTGQWVDPNTGFVLDPNTGQWVDPSAPFVQDPNSGQWVDPNAAATDTSSDTGAQAAAGAAPADQGDGSAADAAAPAADDSAAPADPAFTVGSVWSAGPDVPPPSAVPTTSSWAPPRTVFIPDTGETIDGVFLDSWRAWGGALSWGNPITPEFQEDGHTVQYYGFGRFEYWPDAPDGQVVQFGKLGAQTRPFMLRRGLPGTGKAATDTALAARAWLPLDQAKVDPDSDTWRFIADTGHGVQGAFKTFWEATGEASYLGNPVSEQYKRGDRTFQVFERGIVAQDGDGAPYVLPIGEMLVQRYGLDTAPVAQGDIPTYAEDLFNPPPIIGVSGAPADPNGEKWVRISISQQYAWAMQGDSVLWQGYVSTGRPGFDTPTGTFHVLTKLPSQTMAGVIGGETYNVPNVPDVMYFTNLGHALHGTYWHHNFGQEMSHGCVNLPMDVADWMYQWAPVGMRVEIDP